MKKNPYTLLFGKEPKQNINRFAESSTVLGNFTDEEYSEQLYIVTGVRGAGKTVFMTEVSNKLRENDDWIVIELNSEADLMTDLASKLSSEQKLAEIFRKAKINLSFWGFGLEVDGAAPITNLETAIIKMLESIKKQNKRLLVTIDEVVSNKSMGEFASAFQIFIRQELPIFLLMTGLYQNIEELQNRKNLTFLLRAPKITLKPLNIRMMAESYEKNLEVSAEDANEMSRLTKGYPFAFQVLGYMTWENKGDYKKALSGFRQQLEDLVYDKIWSELSENDKVVATAIAKSENEKVSEIREILDITNNQFNPYKKRLLKKGLITDEYGYARFTLPMFKEYVLTVSESL